MRIKLKQVSVSVVLPVDVFYKMPLFLFRDERKAKR